MSKKQLLLFCIVLMLIFGNGSGMASMIPVHLSRMGVSPANIGFLFSMLYFGIGGSGILAGWLADRFGFAKLMAVISAAGEILASLLLIWAHSFFSLSAAFFLSWFLAGAHAAVVSALVGRQAGKAERGSVFGMIGFVTGLGQMLSGFVYGKIVDGAGFQTLLLINLGISILWTGLSLLYKEPVVSLPEKKIDQGRIPELGGISKHPGRMPFAPTGGYWWIVLAAILGWVVVNGGKLGITLVMSDLAFSAGDISLTVGVASLAALAMPLLLGWMSDRIGRKPLLLALNLLGLIGLFLLGWGHGLAGFCAASSLLSLYSCFGGLSNALAADLLPPQSLGLGLALINSSSYIAGIFSSSLVGLSLKSLGNTKPFLLAMAVPVAAAIFLACVPGGRPETVDPVIQNAA
jgi:MFS family permease